MLQVKVFVPGNGHVPGERALPLVGLPQPGFCWKGWSAPWLRGRGRKRGRIWFKTPLKADFGVGVGFWELLPALFPALAAPGAAHGRIRAAPYGKSWAAGSLSCWSFPVELKEPRHGSGFGRGSSFGELRGALANRSTCGCGVGGSRDGGTTGMQESVRGLVFPYGGKGRRLGKRF